MKAYGKERRAHANRKIRGTSMACPCCIPRSTHRKSQTKVFKKKSRQLGKKEIRCPTECTGGNT